MAVISEEVGFLFIQTPRTGCTAVAEGVLIPKLGGRQIPSQDVTTRSGRTIGAKHCTLGQLLDHDLLDPALADRLLKFATVRNPFDSLVSAYRKRSTDLHELRDGPPTWIHAQPQVLADMEFAAAHTFPEWLEHRFTRPTVLGRWRRRPLSPRHLQGAYLRGVDRIMRFEHLQADLDAVLGDLGLEPVEIPRINQTTSRATERGYADHYDAAARALVEQVFAPDLERFGYRF